MSSETYRDKVAVAGKQEQNFDALLQTALVTPPGERARGILAGVARGQRRILVGSLARSQEWLQRLLPSDYGWMLKMTKGL